MSIINKWYCNGNIFKKRIIKGVNKIRNINITHLYDNVYTEFWNGFDRWFVKAISLRSKCIEMNMTFVRHKRFSFDIYHQNIWHWKFKIFRKLFYIYYKLFYVKHRAMTLKIKIFDRKHKTWPTTSIMSKCQVNNCTFLTCTTPNSTITSSGILTS